MKFSWIVVFGLSALCIALGSHALGVYMDARISASQVSAVNERLARMISHTSELASEKDALSAELAEKTRALELAQGDLAEERETHAPLRKQIETMNGSDEDRAAEVARLNKLVADLRRRLGEQAQAASAAHVSAGKLNELEVENTALSQKMSAVDKRLDGERQQNDRLARELAAIKQKSATQEANIAAERAKSQKLAEDVAAGRVAIRQLEKALADAKLAKDIAAKEILRLKATLKKDASKAKNAGNKTAQ